MASVHYQRRERVNSVTQQGAEQQIFTLPQFLTEVANSRQQASPSDLCPLVDVSRELESRYKCKDVDQMAKP